MNASSFITFGTYMPQQNGIRFYKGLYVTLNKGYVSRLTNSMLRVYNSDIDEHIIL